MRISDWSSDVCSSDLQRTAHRITSPWKWRHLKSVIVPSVQSPPSMLKLHDFCNRARSARACCQNAMMMTGAPIKLTQADAADVADLYNRCSDYFLLQDGDRKSTRLNSSH